MILSIPPFVIATNRIASRRMATLTASLFLLLSLLLLSGCSKKGASLTVLDPQSAEALSLPNLRPLSLPPRYNLDGSNLDGRRASLSQPTASLTNDGSLRISSFSASASSSGASVSSSRDAAFLRRIRGDTRIPNIRRELAESNKQAVPISNDLLKAIRDNVRE